MNILPTKKYLVAVLASLALPLVSCAASFDCDKNAGGVEKLICESPELSVLDSDLEQVYVVALNAVQSKNELKKAQYKWIKEKRNKCKDIRCLKEVYIERINSLKGMDILPATLDSNNPPIDTSKFDDSIKPSDIYTFERLLSGFETCDLKDVYFDEDINQPVNPYFTSRNLKPTLLSHDMAEYSINEEFYGLPVYKVVLPNAFPVFAIYIDAPIENVIEKLSPYLVNGFYTSFPNEETFAKPMISRDNDDPQKTRLMCD